jgi:murein DD-endopeptidase MepM/ murein hydrolase activator NlpD
VERLLLKLKPGVAVQAQVTRFGDLHALQFVTAADTLGTVEFVDGHFATSERPLSLRREVVSRAATIRSSVFAATDEAGIPELIALQLPEVFGSDFDFNTDLRRGDRVTAVYEMLYQGGRLVRPGRLLAAEVLHDREVHRAVWFETGDLHGYFAPDGHNLRRTFLRSPLELSRVTSGFEMRLDPFSHQWQTHRGIDFAAPMGTHVRSTGDGKVEFIGQQNGYGNVVILRHSSIYSTVYAHLNGFARGLKVGDRISQAQVIGYVGQTGWATGPHLHYEFRVHGAFVNPFTVAMPKPMRLDARQISQLSAQSSGLIERLDLLKEIAVAYAD